MYYFAYGSNMDCEQMGKRCRDAKWVAVGRISGRRFRINIRGVATIVPAVESTVHGIVWCLSKADRQNLDRYEGVGCGLYSTSTTEVQLEDGRHLEAFLYLANDDHTGTARPGYLDGIVAAAKASRFPDSYVEELRAWSTTNA